jgi:hypothetical protein
LCLEIFIPEQAWHQAVPTCCKHAAQQLLRNMLVSFLEWLPGFGAMATHGNPMQLVRWVQVYHGKLKQNCRLVQVLPHRLYQQQYYYMMHRFL